MNWRRARVGPSRTRNANETLAGAPMQAALAAARQELAASGAAVDEAALQQLVLARVVAGALAQVTRRRGNAERGADPAPYAAARAARGLPPLLTRAAAAALRAGAPLAVLHGAVDVSDAAGAECGGLLRELALLAASGRMVRSAQAAAGTRSDRVAWLSEDDADALALPALAAAVRALKALAAELSADGGVVAGAGPLVVPARAQVAVYDAATSDADGGADGYVPHWDCVPITAAGGASGSASAPGPAAAAFSNRRAVTMVLYACAPDWDAPRDGGCLRCHVGAPAPVAGDAAAQAAAKAAAQAPGGPPWAVEDVAPLGGRVAVFPARRLLHEVLPARRERFAVTLWAYEPLPA